MYKPDWQYPNDHNFFVPTFPHPLVHHETTKKQLKRLKIIWSGQTFRSEWHEDRVGRHRLDPARLRAARGLRRRSKQGLPACRARRPRQEPSVDAPDMEPMVALGEDPYMLSSLKVREADRAHRVGSIELQPRRVDHDRHGSDGLPLQPALSQTCHRVRHGINNHSARAPQRTPDY